jgi:hypothetical protein
MKQTCNLYLSRGREMSVWFMAALRRVSREVLFLDTMAFHTYQHTCQRCCWFAHELCDGYFKGIEKLQYDC